MSVPLHPLRGKLKLIAICGAARCGKDTLAQAIAGQFGYRQYGFAEPIYAMLRTLPFMENVNSNLSTEEKESVRSFYGTSLRRMLQTLGTEWGRNLVTHDIWVRIMEDKIQRKVDILNHTNFVISDLRFSNEADWVHSLGGIVIRVTRGDEVKVAAHVSENGISLDRIDCRIANDSTIEALCQQAPGINELAEVRRSDSQPVS